MSNESTGLSGGAKTILLVDDQQIIRNFVAQVLKKHGYNLIIAESGEEALEKSRGYGATIHLLLSNIQMPGITGVELGIQISRERPDTRVMLMSGFDGGMLLLNHGWHFLHKPFVPSQLLGVVKTILAEPPAPPTPEPHED
jgi:DNA-binding NtrC family response regulator